jgi:hypothetical protein
MSVHTHILFPDHTLDNVLVQVMVVFILAIQIKKLGFLTTSKGDRDHRDIGSGTIRLRIGKVIPLDKKKKRRGLDINR